MFKFIRTGKLVNNHLMFKCKLMENSMCNFCGKEIENLEHMYFNGNIVKKTFEKRLRIIFDSILIIFFY